MSWSLTSATVRREVSEQFAEGACALAQTRMRWVHGYRFGLRDLRRLDERLETHLDGLLLAPEITGEIFATLLEEQEPGAVSIATMVRLFAGSTAFPEWLLLQLESNPRAAREIDAAFSWTPLSYLRGSASALLASSDVRLRRIAVAAATAHHVALERAVEWLNDEELALASEAARHVATMHMPLPSRPSHGSLETRTHRFWNAWAGLFSGRATAKNLRGLTDLAMEPGEHDDAARAICLLALPVADAHELLRVTTAEPEAPRKRAEGSALIGDPRYIEWLIGLMRDPVQARIAGEAFCTITGVDLVHQELDMEPVVDDAEEDDRPDTPLPATQDADLLWPDPGKVAGWWASNRARFEEKKRYLCGSVPSAEHCLSVLRTGYQPQRGLAALHLGLSVPDVPVLDITLPAWRQQAELERFSAAGKPTP